MNTATEVERIIVDSTHNRASTLRKRSRHTPELDKFLECQMQFSMNIAGRIASHLHFFVIESSSSDEIACALVVLRLLRGICLVHRDSRLVFNNDTNLKSLMAGIGHKSPDVQTACVNTLLAVMVRQVEVIRRFERLNGLKIVCDSFKKSSTSKTVKMAILQFLFFYLVPETRKPDVQHEVQRRTTRDKQLLLSKYLSNVDGLVRELDSLKPFGTGEIEW